MDNKNQKVELQTKDHPKDSKPRAKEFEQTHALALLTRRNSQWELTDNAKKTFTFDGKDLSFNDKTPSK